MEPIETSTMIISLGGSPEPLKKSLTLHRPDRVIFLASHDSVPLSGELLQCLDFKPKTTFKITENPNSMFDCFKAARSCVEEVQRLGLPSENVVVDYTGGTKVMTSALILATIGQPYQFNYVGGEKRTKDGIGIVETGHEIMYPEMNPWSVFAEEERRQVVTLFNSRRFSAVVQIIDNCNRDIPLEIKNFFQFVRALADGFLDWEQFRHDMAEPKLRSGIEALQIYIKDFSPPRLTDFRTAVEGCRNFLSEVVSRIEKGKRLDPILIDDLLNNAQRRIEDRRYDDASARIYRALELYGQISFLASAKCNNDRVRPDVIPSSIREEFVRKYADAKTGLLKLPMTATFLCLKEMDHEAGQRFFEPERQKKIKNIQLSRNSSILAHGITPVGEKQISALMATVSEFVQFGNRFDFPALP